MLQPYIFHIIHLAYNVTVFYNMRMKDPFYTVKELAAILRVHPATVRRAINYGKISAFRVGNGKKSSFRIFKHELERMAAFDLQEIIENRAKELKDKGL